MQKILATPAAKRIAKELNVTLSQVVPAAPDRFIRVKDVRAALNNIGTIDKGYSQKIRMTPLAKKMAELHNIRESELLENSGDRITKSHILEVLRKRSENPTCSAGPADCTALGSEQIIPLKGMRKVIADTMMQSLLTQAQTTVFSDFDTTELLQLHKNLKDSFLERYGVKLTLTHLFIRLIGRALQKHPRLNSALIGDSIHIHDRVHMGIATALEDGLIVPVLRNCNNLSLEEIAEQSACLVTKAQSGQLKPSDYSGGTFTISNLGNMSVDYFTPILNSPETAIMGIARTVKKPVVIHDTIGIRSMTYFSLTYDHRVIDGMDAAKFMTTLEQLLSNPIQLLL